MVVGLIILDCNMPKVKSDNLAHVEHEAASVEPLASEGNIKVPIVAVD